MMKLLRRALCNEKGSAMIMAMLAMTMLLSAAGAYYVTATAGLSNSSGYSYANAAQYAAEAGVRYVLAQQQENTSGGVWNQGTLATSPITLGIDSAGSTAKFTVAVQQVAVGKYRITSTGTAGKEKRVVRNNLSLQVSTFALLQSGIYSGSPWTINTTTGIATAPTDKQYYQVLFGDNVDAKTGFTLTYNVNIKSYTDPNANGYGIYYMVQGDPSTKNPNNLSAYVLQYDPGLTPDQILVKKLKASATTPTYPSDNELQYGDQTVKDAKGKNTTLDNQSFQKTATPYNMSWSNTPINGVYYLTNDLSKNTSSNPTDQMVASFTEVLDELKKRTGTTPKMLNQNHTLTIDVKRDANGNDVHSIIMDNKIEVLNFIDREGTVGGAKYSSGGTGLRVWNANVDFYNTTPQSGQQTISSWSME